MALKLNKAQVINLVTVMKKNGIADSDILSIMNEYQRTAIEQEIEYQIHKASDEIEDAVGCSEHGANMAAFYRK